MTGALMGFPQTSLAIVDYTNVGFVYDGRFGNLYGLANSGALSGIRKWNACPDGKEQRARNLADLGNVTIYFPNTFTYRSQELIISGGAANSEQLNGFSMMDCSPTSIFGITSASLANSTSNRILASGQLVSFTDANGMDVVVSSNIRSGSFTGGAEINCITWGSKWNRKLNVTENSVVLGAVPDGSGSCAWALGYNLGNTTMHLYKVTQAKNLQNTAAAIAAITPANIDATWTTMDAVYGVTVDQTDGNPICGFYNNSGGANRGYFVKFNATTGAIMWKLAVVGATGNISYDVADMSKNIIKAGTLYYIGASGNLWTIDTIAGTGTTQLLDTGGPDNLHGHQMSEDCCGSVIWYGGFTPLSTVPTYLGDFCGAQGIHTGSLMGWRYWPNGAPAPTHAACYEPASARRTHAWSFTLDGHVFYVLDLGQQGTFLYDKTTQQWSQFITQGYTAWNFTNGCMWGQRIIGGDLVTTDVWEIRPGTSFFDNGATSIVHVVTGGVVTRNRIYHSVESFSLACSVGQLQESGGSGFTPSAYNINCYPGQLQTNPATVALAFSDDQGKTWITMDTQTLTQGDWSGEIAWRSLGAFAAPGRIFRITDGGGFIRIDGADANMDNFDEAPPASEQLK